MVIMVRNMELMVLITMDMKQTIVVVIVVTMEDMVEATEVMGVMVDTGDTEDMAMLIVSLKKGLRL